MSGGGADPRCAGFEVVMETGGNLSGGDIGCGAGNRGGELRRGSDGRGVVGRYGYRKLRQKVYCII